MTRIDDEQTVTAGLGRRLRLRAAAAGAVSACACALYGMTTVDVKEQDVTVWFFDNRFLLLGPLSLPAGAIFGLALWWTLRAMERVSALGAIWLIACSVLAWHVAVFYAVIPVVQALDGVAWLPDLGKRIVFGMPAGGLGALCVAGSAAVLLRPLRSLAAVLAVTVTGAVTGSAAGLMGDPPLSILPLFLVWQAGVLVVLATCLMRRVATVPRR